MISYYMFTNEGSREVNEDSCNVVNLNDKYCFIVADGLGGHGRGEEASALVVNHMSDEFMKNANIDDFLESSVVNAQVALMKAQEEKHTRNEMKTTLVAAMVDGLNLKWIHVGDSRLYRFVKNKVKERTIDHSVPQMLAMTGEIKEKEIRNHPDRNRLLKVMGIEWESPKYTVSPVSNVLDTQALLLCTDGFWELITEKEMCKVLKKCKSVEEWINRMAEIVAENGKDKKMDNYTAIGVWIS